MKRLKVKFDGQCNEVIVSTTIIIVLRASSQHDCCAGLYPGIMIRLMIMLFWLPQEYIRYYIHVGGLEC